MLSELNKRTTLACHRFNDGGKKLRECIPVTDYYWGLWMNTFADLLLLGRLGGKRVCPQAHR